MDLAVAADCRQQAELSVSQAHNLETTGRMFSPEAPGNMPGNEAANGAMQQWAVSAVGSASKSCKALASQTCCRQLQQLADWV